MGFGLTVVQGHWGLGSPGFVVTRVWGQGVTGVWGHGVTLVTGSLGLHDIGVAGSLGLRSLLGSWGHCLWRHCVPRVTAVEGLLSLRGQLDLCGLESLGSGVTRVWGHKGLG